MTMKTVYFLEAYYNIRKNMLPSVLFILCFLILFILFGEVSVQSVLASRAAEDAEHVSLIEYTQIRFVSFTSLSPIRQEMALYDYSDIDILAAGLTMDNITNTLRDKYNDYENKRDRSIVLESTKVERGDYCSYDLYELCSSMLIIKEGKWFEKEDFNRAEQVKKGYVAPVLLGAKFAEKYNLSVGDTFIADMFYDEERRNYVDEYGYEDGQTYTWKVIGIFEEDSSYFYRGQIQPVNNRVILPDYEIPTLDEILEQNNGEINDDVIEYICSRLFRYFRTTDYYIKRTDMHEALEYVNEEIAKSAFLSQYYIAKESSDTLTMAAQNQEKASNFYSTVTIITYIISAFGIVMSVNNKIQSNKRNYAIHSLNGATVFDLIMCSVTEITLLMLVADAFFFAVPYSLYYHRVNMGNGIYIGREAPLFVLAINILTIIIAVVVSVIALHRFDTVEYLKKKE